MNDISNLPKQAGMACPVCKVDLLIAERQKIEIDYCPRCRGVWLDRGELDKLIERSVDSDQSRTSEERPREKIYDRPRDQHKSYGHHGYRRKSWLSEIFD